MNILKGEAVFPRSLRPLPCGAGVALMVLADTRVSEFGAQQNRAANYKSLPLSCSPRLTWAISVNNRTTGERRAGRPRVKAGGWCAAAGLYRGDNSQAEFISTAALNIVEQSEGGNAPSRRAAAAPAPPCSTELRRWGDLRKALNVWHMSSSSLWADSNHHGCLKHPPRMQSVWQRSHFICPLWLTPPAQKKQNKKRVLFDAHHTSEHRVCTQPSTFGENCNKWKPTPHFWCYCW